MWVGRRVILSVAPLPDPALGQRRGCGLYQNRSLLSQCAGGSEFGQVMQLTWEGFEQLAKPREW